VRVAVSWLRELCPVDLPVGELAEVLTFKGAKVEGIIQPWERLRGVVVARVVEVRDHPRSDTLCLATVDTGSGQREVVVGVRNMRPGDLVPLAGPGATLPGLPEPLGAREIRGVVSDGMLCSPRELGISPEHRGILILPPGTPLGADISTRFGLDDAVLDIEVTPNRPDLLSILGVAREAAAATGAPLTVAPSSFVESGEKAEEVATVEVLDPERCPRYLARVIRGVAVGPSPIRAQARLTASGMRPLSNVVDATNYALLERGHPLHAFDLALLEGAGIVVRRALAGERLVTLDDVERTLSPDDLVIADRANAVAVAGVMGSASAEVSPSTADVLLESAYFEPEGVRLTARRLGLRTEASARFERGADPEAVSPAADRAAELITEWSGGTVLAGAVEVGEEPPRRRLVVRPERASLVLGYQVTPDDAEAALARLGFAAERSAADVQVAVPGYRSDVVREIDLIEEIAREQGYERVGSELPGVRQAGGVPASYALRRRLREAFVRAGLGETKSYSFASQADLDLMGQTDGLRVANPLTAEEAFLRTSLVPGLLRTLGRNMAHGARSAEVFEVGRVFGAGGPAPGVPEGETVGPVEERELGAAVMGGQAGGFPDPPRHIDFLDAKGVLEAVLEIMSVSRWALGDPLGSPFHPARSAEILVGGHSAGSVGELHPRVCAERSLPAGTAVLELEASVIGRVADPTVTYREVPRFPPVRRDLAFQVDAAVPAGAVGEAIIEGGGELVDPESVMLFDVFTGPSIPMGSKSLAFSVDFRAADRTLTDEEADAAVRAIVKTVSSRFGAELRGA
jgi:phenylalanyl-tRNA synthetase beta chain